MKENTLCNKHSSVEVSYMYFIVKTSGKVGGNRFRVQDIGGPQHVQDIEGQQHVQVNVYSCAEIVVLLEVEGKLKPLAC